MRGWYKKGTIANRFRVDMSMPVMGAGVRGSALTPTVFIKDKLSASHRMASMKVKFGTIYTPQGGLTEGKVEGDHVFLFVVFFLPPRGVVVWGFLKKISIKKKFSPPPSPFWTPPWGV